MNALHPGAICSKFGRNLPSVSLEDENVKELPTYRRDRRQTKSDPIIANNEKRDIFLPVRLFPNIIYSHIMILVDNR